MLSFGFMSSRLMDWKTTVTMRRASSHQIKPGPRLVAARIDLCAMTTRHGIERYRHADRLSVVIRSIPGIRQCAA